MELPERQLFPIDWLEACLDPARRVDLLQIWSAQVIPGQKGPNRFKPINSLLFVERGGMVALTGEREFPLKAGDVLWIPPGVKRCFMSEPEATESATCVRFRFSVRTESHELTPLTGPRVWHGRMDLERSFTELRVLFEDRSGMKDPLLRATLTRLSAALFRDSSKEQSAGLNQAQQERVLRLIDRSLDNGVTVSQLAQAARLSQDWFARLFKLSFGESPRRYLVNRRLALAAELLTESPLTIKEICREVGMRDQNLFSRLFRKRFGCTPTQYRNDHEIRSKPAFPD